MALTEDEVKDWTIDGPSGFLVEPHSGKLVDPSRLQDYDFSDQPVPEGGEE